MNIISLPQPIHSDVRLGLSYPARARDLALAIVDHASAQLEQEDGRGGAVLFLERSAVTLFDAVALLKCEPPHFVSYGLVRLYRALHNTRFRYEQGSFQVSQEALNYVVELIELKAKAEDFPAFFHELKPVNPPRNLLTQQYVKR